LRSRVALAVVSIAGALGFCGSLSALWACDEGSAAGPPVPPGLDVPCSDFDGGGYRVCPCNIEPTFSSIYTKVMATDSCGADRNGACHSATGGINSGVLYYEFEGGFDPRAAYVEFLGADGGGAPAQNVEGMVPIKRVVPGSPDASMLYIKVTTMGIDPKYGHGMPRDFPGSVCPATVDAVRTWIEQGAPFD